MAITRSSLVCRSVVGLLLVAILTSVPRESSLAAALSDVCREHEPLKVFEVVKSTPSEARLVSRSRFLAGDGQNSLIFDSPYSAPKPGKTYRVLIQGKPTESTKRLHLINGV